MSFSHQLKRERELRGWSQIKIAREIHTTPSRISLWEHGRAFPSPYFRQQLCQLFGKNAAELGLLEETDVQENAGTGASRLELEKVEQHIIPANSASKNVPVYDTAIPPWTTPLNGLIGRNTLQTHIEQRLCSGDKMVTLHGLPGVGKTALAAHITRQQAIRTTFYDGILWARLGPTPDEIRILQRWCQLMGITQSDITPQNKHVWLEQLQIRLNQLHMLIVLDDVWDIGAVPTFTIGGPLCSYLITTRFPYIDVHLSSHTSISVPELTEEDAYDLLNLLVPGLAHVEHHYVLDIARLVGGLPLGLIIIGKYLQTHAYSGQPRRIRAAIKYTQDGKNRLHLSLSPTLKEDQAKAGNKTGISLYNTISSSIQHLPLHAQETLYALSLFPAKPQTFSEEAALFVSDQLEETLDMLTDVGLVESLGNGRYTLHQVLADYARLHPIDKAVSLRFVCYALRILEQKSNDTHLSTQEQKILISALDVARTIGMHDAFLQKIRTYTRHLPAEEPSIQNRTHLQQTAKV